MKLIQNINIFDLRYNPSTPEHKFFDKLEENYIKQYPLGYICIPVNGQVNSGGLAVMGAGLAKDAATRFPRLQMLLGLLLQNFENQVFIFKKEKLFTFPTKDDWRNPSTIDRIVKSCKQLKTLTIFYNIHRPVYLPKVGCGLGGLDWNKVKGFLNKELNSDQFIVVEN